MYTIIIITMLFHINFVYNEQILFECPNPTYKGCIVTAKSKLALNIRHFVATCHNEYRFCSDNTLRITSDGEKCLKAHKGKDGYYGVSNEKCDIYANDKPEERWEVKPLGEEVLKYGIPQQLVQIKSKIDGTRCLKSMGSASSHAPCDAFDVDQQFYFQNRGSLLKEGKLFNKSLKKCLKIRGAENAEFFIIDDCSGDGYLELFENGEMIYRKKSEETKNNNKCVVPANENDQKKVLELKTCSMDLQESQWDISRCNEKGSCLLKHSYSNKCIRLFGNELSLSECTIADSYFFDFVNGNWNPSTTEFAKIICNQNGKITVEVENQITYGNGTTEAKGGELSLSTEMPFIGVDVSATASFSLEQTWEESYGSSVKSIVSCENYEDSEGLNDTFTHGCLWQLKVKTFNWKEGKSLVWRSTIIKCTRSTEKPKCGVFMKCKDKLCRPEECIPEDKPADISEKQHMFTNSQVGEKLPATPTSVIKRKKKIRKTFIKK